MIQSFGDRETEALYQGRPPRKYLPIARMAERKLVQLNNAQTLRDLGAIPGNRFETLKGARRGEYSVRINDRLRIVFRWGEQGPRDVKIEDYH